MNYVHVVALLAIIQFFFFGILVGRARARYGIKAPAISGHEQFERAFRIHVNTLEQLVGFLPALWIASYYWPQALTALLGVIYLLGRFVYWRAYRIDPSTRAVGFLMSAIPTFILLVLGLIGAIFKA